MFRTASLQQVKKIATHDMEAKIYKKKLKLNVLSAFVVSRIIL